MYQREIQMKIIQRLLLNFELNPNFVADMKFTCELLEDDQSSIKAKNVQNCYKHAEFLNGKTISKY